MNRARYFPNAKYVGEGHLVPSERSTLWGKIDSWLATEFPTQLNSSLPITLFIHFEACFYRGFYPPISVRSLNHLEMLGIYTNCWWKENHLIGWWKCEKTFRYKNVVHLVKCETFCLKLWSWVPSLIRNFMSLVKMFFLERG